MKHPALFSRKACLTWRHYFLEPYDRRSKHRNTGLNRLGGQLLRQVLLSLYTTVDHPSIAASRETSCPIEFMSHHRSSQREDERVLEQNSPTTTVVPCVLCV